MGQVALGSQMLHYQASRLSGGERQRVAIARALAAEPDVMICDEITSALDVSVQGSIVELLEGLRQERGISMLFVTHNLALVRSIAARVEILQEGRVVEAGSVVDGHGHARSRSTPASSCRTAHGSTDVGAHLHHGVPALGPPVRRPPARRRGGAMPSCPRAAAASCRAGPRPIAVRGRGRRPPARPRRLGRGDVDDLVARGGPRHCRPRVVRRRARPRHAVPRRLDDQVGAGPPGRTGGPRRSPGARPTPSTSHVPELRAPATTAHGARPAHDDDRASTGSRTTATPTASPPGCSAASPTVATRAPCSRGVRPASRPAPGSTTAPPTRRCSTGCASAPPAHLRRRRGPAVEQLGCTRDAFVAVDGTASRWPAAGWPPPHGTGPASRCSPSTAAPSQATAARRRLGRRGRAAGVPVPARRPAAQQHHDPRRLRLPLVADGRRRARVTADGSRGQFAAADRHTGAVVVKTSLWPYDDFLVDRQARDLSYLGLHALLDLSDAAPTPN